MQLYRTLLVLCLLQQYDADDLSTAQSPQSIEYYDTGEEVLDPLIRQQVSVRRRRKDAYRFGTGHICGGFLIAPHMVLSAAHCFVDQSHYDGSFLSKSDIVVVLGAINRFMEHDNTQSFELSELIMPMSKFNLSSYSQDIALLVINGIVCPPNSKMLGIPLATASFAANTSCQLSGWGRPQQIYNMDLLVIMTVSLIGKEDCMRQLQLLGQSDRRCAGFLQQPSDATCTTDTGGPLVCNDQLAGIVSWGIKCGDSQLPAVYTDVSYYNQWIGNVMTKHPWHFAERCFHSSNEVKQTKNELAKQKSSNIAIKAVEKMSIALQCAFYVLHLATIFKHCCILSGSLKISWYT